MDNYLKLKFNVLFRDIFYFYNKAFPSNDYNVFLNDFVKLYYEDDILDNIGDLVKIIDSVDILENYDNSYKCLTSIFSNIQLDNSKPIKHFIPLNKLELNESIFPKFDEENILSFENLWTEFINEFELIKDKNNFNTILALLKKYTSTICYNDDISLFEHLKITNALSNCLYLNNDTHTDENPFLIVNGDISGIQNFIYKISGTKKSQKGISRRLRGRSLFVTLLSESISNKIISELNLDNTNVLFCSGGRFTILVPNTKEDYKKINDIEDEVNKEFIEDFNADLCLILASCDVSFSDLKDFNVISSKSSRLLSKKKKIKFINHLDILFNEKKGDIKNFCKYCGNKIEEIYVENDEENICEKCKNQYILGKRVANARYMVTYKSFFISKFHIFGLNYDFFKSERDVINFVNLGRYENFHIYKLNDTNFLDIQNQIFISDVSFDFKFIGNIVPNISDELLNFEHLSRISKGSNYIGVLKMDVDNLGEIFYKGFNQKNNQLNIFRLSSLSFFLDLFFLGLINEIAKNFNVYSDCGSFKEYFIEIELDFDGEIKKVYKPKNNFKVPIELEQFSTSTIYINYSGGDDLLVIGPYDDIIEFAVLLRDKFKQWTGWNSSINISAGIGIYNHMFPIGNAAIQVESFLNKSKSCGKDKITLFNQTLSWDDMGDIIGFKRILNFGKKLEILDNEGLIPRNFIFSLLKIWEKNKSQQISQIDEKNIDDEDLWYKLNRAKASTGLFLPKYYYKLSDVDIGIRDDLASCFKFIPWIKIPVSWVSLRRGG